MFLSLLLDALASPLGIVVKVSDTMKAKQAFYRAGREGGITGLTIKTSPFADDELWIVRKDAKEI